MQTLTVLRRELAFLFGDTRSRLLAGGLLVSFAVASARATRAVAPYEETVASFQTLLTASTAAVIALTAGDAVARDRELGVAPLWLLAPGGASAAVWGKTIAAWLMVCTMGALALLWLAWQSVFLGSALLKWAVGACLVVVPLAALVMTPLAILVGAFFATSRAALAASSLVLLALFALSGMEAPPMNPVHWVDETLWAVAWGEPWSAWIAFLVPGALALPWLAILVVRHSPGSRGGWS